MIDHDQLFKELLTTFFVEFVQLFLPELSVYLDPGSVTFLDKELLGSAQRRRKREVDIVAIARFVGEYAQSDPIEGLFLIHVENQSKRQSDFEKRMFRYWARLYEKHHLPVYPIALFSYDAPSAVEADRFVVRFPDLNVLDFRYRTIQLNRLSWRDFVTQKNPVASALMAKMAIAPADRWRVKLECLRLLATLRLDSERMQLISGFVDTYLELSSEENALLQTALAEEALDEQEAVMEIVTSWKREGIEQGLQQGLQQGRELGMVRVVSLQLKNRFRSLTDASLARIQDLSEPQLIDLAGAVLEFVQPSDLDDWFAQRAS